MAGESSGLSEFWRRSARRIIALVAFAAMIAALPVGAIAHAAEPMTLGDWMRTIFVTSDRKIDRSSPALNVAPPAPPPVAVQTSSEQVPPKQPMLRDRLPDAWLRRDPWKPRNRDRGPRPE